MPSVWQPATAHDWLESVGWIHATHHGDYEVPHAAADAFLPFMKLPSSPSFPRALTAVLRLIGGLLLAAIAPASAAPTIAALVDEVLARHPELAFYRAEIAAAQTGVRLAAAPPNPELTAQAGRKRTRDPAGILAGEGTAWSVSLMQTFEWPGRIPLRKAIANRDVALAELGLARFQSALAARARTLAYGLAAARERADAAAEVAARFRALKETFLARDPAGLAPLLEIRVIEAQELALQRRATEARLALQAALTELNLLRGLPVDTALAVAPARLVLAAPPPLEQLLTAARDNHFELRAKRLELEQQGFVVQLARHERRPAFSVGPYVSRENSDGRETTLGLGLSVPLPLTSRQGAGIENAEARRRQAEAAVTVAQQAMEHEVITVAQEYEARRDESARWVPGAPAHFREAAELADRHYRLGAVPLATYVSLQTAYLDAIDALLDTQREALAAGLRLQLLTGLDFNAVRFAP